VTLRDEPVSERSTQEGSSGASGLDDLEEQADAIADFVDELLAKMEIDAIAEPNPQGDHMYVDIVDGPEDDMALLIGRHGQTLEAIQELARMVVGRKLDQRIRVIVDVEDYRKRRESRLEEDAREAALRVAAEGGEHEFDPMNAYERKLVHDAVAGVDGVETVSRGEEPSRYVVIRPV
jgi:spoIIIJ-associated protein